MRLICTFPDDKSHAFSYYLASKGIENTCEEVPGTENVRIWIYDEDEVARAQQLYQEYQKDPSHLRYSKRNIGAVETEEDSLFQTKQPEEKSPPKKRPLLSPAPYGPLSTLIIAAAILLFFWSQIGQGKISPPQIPGIVQAPILAPVEKNLIYDYPAYFELRDRLFHLYTPQDVENKKPPSAEAALLIKQLQKTPVWMGIYDRFVENVHHLSQAFHYPGPLFEKIRQGQIWRLFTPALLHLNLLHIFFNLLWFILLANQIEFRLGWWRYLLLIFATAIASNTAQYLMSGPFFMGLSGVIVGLAGFIWARQQVAPWEGYLLQRLTSIFLALFVIGIFVLQLVFFFLQIFGKMGTFGLVANTAHIVGGIVGYLLGRLPFFAIRKNLPRTD